MGATGSGFVVRTGKGQNMRFRGILRSSPSKDPKLAESNNMIVAVESEYDAASIRPLPRACQRRSRQLPQRNFFRPLLILRVFAVLNVECQMPSTRTIGVLCECDRAIKDQVKKTVRTTSAACNVFYNINHWSRSSEGLSRDLSIRPDGSDRKAANEHVLCVCCRYRQQ